MTAIAIPVELEFEEFEDYHPPYEYMVRCMLCKDEGSHPYWMLHHTCEVES